MSSLASRLSPTQTNGGVATAIYASPISSPTSPTAANGVVSSPNQPSSPVQKSGPTSPKSSQPPVPLTTNGNGANGASSPPISPPTSPPNSPLALTRSGIPISASKPPIPKEREELIPPGTPQTPRMISLRHMGGSNSSISSGNRPVDLVMEERSGSSQSMATAVSPADSSASDRHRTKMTVGEIVQQIELRIRTLLKYENFTTAETLMDLQFLTQQARYSGDVHIKRKLVVKMVEFGILDLFIKVLRSAQMVDYLRYLAITELDEEGAHASTSDLRDEDDGKDDVSLSEIQSVSDAGDRKLSKVASDRSRAVPDCVKNLRCVVTIISNISEKSFTLCEDCIRKGVLRLLLHDLSDMRLGVPELQDPSKMYLVKGYLGILGNIIRFHADARDFYREAGAVKVLQQYLKSNLLIIKTRTIMLLSYIINESENDIINASDKNLSLMVKVLLSCVESENHFSRKYGYWAVEILAGETGLLLV